MRETIPDRGAANRPPFVVVGDEATGVVILEADGRRHWIGPDEARRIAHALLRAADLVGRAVPGADGGGFAPGDDLPDVA